MCIPLLFGAPDSCQCGASLERALTLGVPIAPAKTEGPVTKLIFLGIEFGLIDNEPPPRNARTPVYHDSGLGVKEVLHQEGVAVTNWISAARVSCH